MIFRRLHALPVHSSLYISCAIMAVPPYEKDAYIRMIRDWMVSVGVHCVLISPLGEHNCGSNG